MQVEVRGFGDGLDMFVPGARPGQRFQVEVPAGATVGEVLEKLGIPRNVFCILVNGRHATSETPCNSEDRIDLLEAINGG